MRETLVEKVQGHAFELEEIAFLAIVDADNNERDLHLITFGERLASSFGNVDPVIARRVVTARTLVEGARASRRQVAMTRPAIAFAVAENRQIARIVRVIRDRRTGMRARQVDEGAHKARAHELRYQMQKDFRLTEILHLLVDRYRFSV